jgi:hypothetical protein
MNDTINPTIPDGTGIDPDQSNQTNLDMADNDVVNNESSLAMDDQASPKNDENEGPPRLMITKMVRTTSSISSYCILFGNECKTNRSPLCVVLYFADITHKSIRSGP